MPQRSHEVIERWRGLFRPVNMADEEPAQWVIPHLLVPGLNLLVGSPKTFKSTLVLQIIASMLNKQPIGEAKKGRVRSQGGTVVYFGAEQSVGRIKDIYEKRIIRRKLQSKHPDWDFIMPREAFDWQIDQATSSEHDVLEFLKEWKPTICIFDPFVHFHSLDENDPQMVRPLLPLKKLMAGIHGALVIVHHLRKKTSDPRAGAQPRGFDEIRGTGALWGAADAAHMLTKTSSGGVRVDSEFKDFEPDTWFWRPAILSSDNKGPTREQADSKQSRRKAP